jgi:hypothetical protein
MFCFNLALKAGTLGRGCATFATVCCFRAASKSKVKAEDAKNANKNCRDFFHD